MFVVNFNILILFRFGFSLAHIGIGSDYVDIHLYQKLLMTEIDEGKSESDNFLMEFYIHDNILIGEGDSETEIVSHIPVCPVIVFVNSRSSGQLGGDLLITYRNLLNKHHVFINFQPVHRCLQKSGNRH
ncbi:hypothetical protein C5167_048336 [Papaver somniferum]|uniref:DAGKc domain-containing protein n=1 Tax=Papaver somniferum TaxID=3469 RepID=A0A4Y7KJ15_PAPSO|nr:hypothetical protein C5167_048336 [Papaver somniferum]